MNNPINLYKQDIRKTSDNDMTFKMGIVIDDNLIWCLNDFEFYTIPIELHHDFFEETENDRKRNVLKEHLHEYIEFTSSISSVNRDTEGLCVCKEQTENIIDDFWFKTNKISEVVSFYFSELDVKCLINEMEEIVDNLNIDDIIISYQTYYYCEEVKINSDTWGTDIEVRRTSTYYDDYIGKLLPCKVFYTENARDLSTHVSAVPFPDEVLTRLYVDLKDIDRLYINNIKVGEPYVDKLGIYNVPKNSLFEEAEIRENARLTYNRKDHIMTLVNKKIKSIIAKKIEIEAKYHIHEAMNLIKNYPCYKLTRSR
jgi:hypothetical protein